MEILNRVGFDTGKNISRSITVPPWFVKSCVSPPRGIANRRSHVVLRNTVGSGSEGIQEATDEDPNNETIEIESVLYQAIHLALAPWPEHRSVTDPS